jgi:hypothetical protein
VNPNINLSPAICRLLRHVELALVAIVALNSVMSDDSNVAIGVFFLAAFTLLSLILPVHRPLWQRRGYVALGLALVLIAYSFGIDFNVFLYLYRTDLTSLQG